MPPRLQLTALLVSAPLATAYLTGEDVTLCWVSRNGTRELLSTCGADFVEFVTTLPTTLDATRQYDVTYRAHVASAALIPTDGFDFPHVNLHVCPRRITFCTPFIADTPELATHSTELGGAGGRTQGDARGGAGARPAAARARRARGVEHMSMVVRSKSIR